MKKQFTTTSLALAAILLTLSNANANEIYITQAGDNLDLTIDQKGSNNQIKGLLSSNASISGNDNTVELNQGYEGNNLIEMSIDGANNDVTVNQERFSSGYDTDSYGHHSSSIELDGNGNTVDITQRNNSNSSAGHSSNVIFRGDNNSLTTLQTGTGGSNGHLSWVYTHDTESNNTVDIFQNSDSADHKAYVSMYSDGNTIDIDQTGTSQNRAYVIFFNSNAGPTDFTLNQNGGDTYGNADTGSYATISCGNVGGCIVTVSQ